MSTRGMAPTFVRYPVNSSRLHRYRVSRFIRLTHIVPYFSTLPAPASPAYLPIRLTVVAVSANVLNYGVQTRVETSEPFYLIPPLDPLTRGQLDPR